MTKKLALLASLLLASLLLAACGELAGVRFDRPEEADTVQETALYLPLVSSNHCVPGEKKGLAGNWFVAGAWGWIDLCMAPNSIWHQWTPWIWFQPRQPVRLPFVWSDELDEFRRAIPARYGSIVMFANEPDLQGQAWMTPEETAAVAMSIISHCGRSEPPDGDCKLAGPNISQLAVGTDFMGRFWKEFLRLGGERDDIAKNTFHYYDCVTGLTLTETVDAFVQDLPKEVRDKPIWITEIGSCRNSYDDAYGILSEANHDDRMERWFYFAPSGYNLPPVFTPDGELTEVGKAVRDAN